MTDSTVVTSPPAVSPRRQLRSRLRRLDLKLSPYLYVSPFFVVFIAFGLFPLNYTALLQDSYFWNAVVNTLAIWVMSTVPQLVLALVIAHVLNTKLRARTLFRMSILLPQVTSLVAVALIFAQLFSNDYGLVNYI